MSHCKDCKHFGGNSQWVASFHPDRTEWRDCNHPDRKAVSTGYDHYASDISCAPDFGCIQFEEAAKNKPKGDK